MTVRLTPPPWRARVRLVLWAAVLLAATWAAPLGAGEVGEPCAAAAGQARVWLVVDYGTLPGAPGGITKTCVVVPDGATGAAVLQSGVGGLRFDGSGLLCAIGGYPSGSACGERTGTGYRYWAYFHGGSSWTYSGIGPDGHRVHDGAVEGWHFVEGRGNPTDPPPGASAANGCPPAPTTAPPVTSPAPTPHQAPDARASGGGGAVGADQGGGAAAASGSSGGATPAGSGGSSGAGARPGGPAGSSANSSTPPASAAGSAEQGDGAGDSTSSSVDGDTGPAGAEPIGDTRADGRRGGANDAGDPPGEVAAAPAPSPASAASSGAPPVGAFVGVALVALLAGGAAFQFRKRAAR